MSLATAALPWRTLLGLWVAVVGITLLIVWIYWPFLAHAIALEHSPIAWLQSSMLVAAAVLAMVLGHLQGKARWFIVAVALALMALDERFMGHERLKDWLLYSVYDGDAASMGWRGDAPVAIYVVGGLATLAVMWRVLDAAARAFLLVGVAVGAVAIALDIADLKVSWQIVEELLELVAETLFVSGLLVQVCAEKRRLGGEP